MGMERQAEEFTQLERHMDVQARMQRAARVVGLIGDEMRVISTQLEQEAKAARMERRHTRGR
jgi:hypothetical protein